MEEVNKPRSLVDDRPLTPQEIRKIQRGESIWGNLETPKRRKEAASDARKQIAV